MKQDLQISPRLKKISELVPCDCFLADIGTDHAFLPIYLCKERKIKKAVAVDINEGPLKRAGETIAEYKMEEFIKTKLSDGFSKVKQNEFSCAVIAGMGGELIAEIIAKAPYLKSAAYTLILQPMTKTDQLRRYLWTNGFVIIEEHFVKEGNKLYVILSVFYTGDVQEFNDADCIAGKNGSGLLLKEYLFSQIEKLKRIRNGISLSTLPNKCNKINYFTRIIMILAKKLEELSDDNGK